MRHLALAIILVSAPPLLAQQAAHGIFHGGLSANAITPNSSYTLTFPVTAVGATSIADCYYNCFLTGGGNCNYSGTISLVKSVGHWNGREKHHAQSCYPAFHATPPSWPWPYMR